MMDLAASRCQEAATLLRSLQASHVGKFLVGILTEPRSLLT